MYTSSTVQYSVYNSKNETPLPSPLDSRGGYSVISELFRIFFLDILKHEKAPKDFDGDRQTD